ncbi:MAG: 30S ribosomal protein S12 methylthiotransferase RimO [Candidatus Hydrogenedentes bacterium]|nr:30S ribosomal protein S12 methylthiotransferase RimO [Candidatus Hydrogenedentota bacterium]
MSMRVGLITLGCDKNTVDNEYLAGQLESAGCDVVAVGDDNASGLDAVIITTCGFIGDAKQQSVDTIVEWTERKAETDGPKRVYVAGCLAQRYADELMKEIPEIDGIVGVGQFQRLTHMILETGSPKVGVEHVPSVAIYPFMQRRRLDTKPYTFLKISDGCNHACTFCSIPLMKGKHRSVQPQILQEEVRSLVSQGVREFNLVAQDLADYGRDLGKDYRLPELLRDLCAVDGDFWLRCLYVYPGGVTDAFLDVMTSEKKIVPYLDMPLQHLDPSTLKRMKRPYREANTAELVRRLRDAVPGLALRTTMIVGFPGESDIAHRHMLDDLAALRFNWLGSFQYSLEDDTPAGQAEDQIEDRIKEQRWRAVMELQAEITESYNRARVGTRTRILIEDYDEGEGCYVGRSATEAPEVDGCVYVQSEAPLAVGQFVAVEIVDSDVYDVTGRVTQSVTAISS